jgi:hypothetical protein
MKIIPSNLKEDLKIFLKSELVSWFWKYMVSKSSRGWGDPRV